MTLQPVAAEINLRFETLYVLDALTYIAIDGFFDAAREALKTMRDSMAAMSPREFAEYATHNPSFSTALIVPAANAAPLCSGLPPEYTE